MNYSSTIVSSEDDHNLEQIKLVLDMFEKNTKVLTDPLFTIILILYGVLVSFAGKYSSKITIIDISSSSVLRQFEVEKQI